MTISARNWVWEQTYRRDWQNSDWVQLSSPEKFVLLYLAERENVNYGYAYPSVDSISQTCRLSRRTVLNALTALEDSRLIRREQTRRTGGQWPQNTYYLAVTAEYRNKDDTWKGIHGESGEDDDPLGTPF